ncbi:hypothetical protein KR059_003483, partial [Drosophila kikkawai]
IQISFLLFYNLKKQFVSLSQAQDDAINWDEVIKCAKVGTKVVATLVRTYIPDLRIYLNCIDYTPPPNPTNSLYGYVRAAFELLKRSVEGNIQCLVTPIQKGINVLKPSIAKLEEYKCIPK